jgi:hypothetical protein
MEDRKTVFVGKREYRLFGDTYFDVETPDNLCKILNELCAPGNRTNQYRYRIFYGDRETGKCWMEEYDTMGYFGRSLGPVKVALLIHNRCSTGGPAIIDKNVMKIVRIKDNYTIYQDPKFYIPNATMSLSPSGERVEVKFGDECHASFTDEKKATRYMLFMMGRRHNK